MYLNHLLKSILGLTVAALATDATIHKKTLGSDITTFWKKK